jgi:hypothetical protein
MAQKRSLISTRRCTVAASASVSNSKVSAISVRPTCTSRSTPSVPRASQWPSATTLRAPQLHAHRGGNRADGHTGTRDQGLQQHVRGAGQAPILAGGRMQTGVRLPAPRAHSAGEAIHIEHGLGARQRKCGSRLLPITLLQRRLSARSSFASIVSDPVA